MKFISKARSCIAGKASKAWSVVEPKLPNRTPILIAVVTLLLARNRIANFALKTLRLVGSKLPNPTLTNAGILLIAVALLVAAVKKFASKEDAS